jgi:hypothetical protein
MNFQKIDTAICNYVGEKNRQRIQEHRKRPMISSPVSPWRSATSVDDIRRDMINKISAVLIGWQVTYYSLRESILPAEIGISVLSTGIVVSAYQLSKTYNNAFWRIAWKDEGWVKWRTLSWVLFASKGLSDLVATQLLDLSPVGMVPFIQSIIYHYIVFHLIYTRDTLPKKPEEKIAKNIWVFQGT